MSNERTPEQQYKHDWYLANRERLAKKARQYYLENRERIIERVGRRQRENPEENAKYQSEWRKRNPGKHVQYQLSRRATLMGAEIDNPVTLEQLISFFGPHCMFPDCDKDDLTSDHVMPLSLGGAHAAWNQQILCRSHNAAKSNRSCADYRQFVVV